MSDAAATPEPNGWALVRAAARDDPAARRRLVETTIDDLWRLAMRLTRSPEEADEVVQETYARAFGSLRRLTPNGRFEGYLARIATNLVLERWRRARPRAAMPAEVPDPALEPWQRLAESEEEARRLAAVWQAIGELDPKPRAALLLYYAQGLSCERIARTLDAPTGTVKTWLHRGRKQVRRRAEALLAETPAAGPAPRGDRP